MSSPPQRRSIWLDKRLPGIAHAATIVAAILALLAVAFTAYQLAVTAEQGRQQALLEREIAANGSWERYMELASQHPQFAAGLEFASLTTERKTAYLWFVERMLFAGEQVLGIDPSDRQWQLAIETEARIHRSYLASQEFLQESICSYTRALRQTLVRAFSNTDPRLSRLLAQRDTQCTAEGYSE